MTLTLDRAAPPRRRWPLLGHSPALDGLRGLAVVLVMIFHFTGHTLLPGGWAGVDVFFVLSGFLITALLLDEQRVHGRVALGRFYLRRAARLLPALLLMLVVWTGLLLAFHDSSWLGASPAGDGSGDPVAVGPALGDIGVSLAYAANWMYALGPGHAPLAHLWSLSVEEQFYLLWPGLLLLVVRRRVWPALALAAVSALLPWLYWQGADSSNRLYFGTDTRAVGLLAGAVAALVWHRRRTREHLAPWAAPRAWAGLAVVAVVAATLGNAPIKFLLAPTLLGLAVAQVVPHLIDHPRGRLGRLLTPRWLIWAGQRSYALYLWHYLWATWTHPLPAYVGVPVGVLGAVACTQVSWLLVEAPALRWARRFRVKPAPVTPPMSLRAAA